MKKAKNTRFVVGTAVGAVMGALTGWLIFILLEPLVHSSALVLWFADVSAALAQPVIELVVRVLCGPSPDMGCASGTGLLAFFIIWPMTLVLMFSLIGASIGLVGTVAYSLSRDSLTRQQ